jgi:hypothetical protein
MAKRRNVARHPNHSVSHTNGVAAAIFPAVPTEISMAERVAKYSGENQVVISFNGPIKITGHAHAQEQPAKDERYSRFAAGKQGGTSDGHQERPSS